MSIYKPSNSSPQLAEIDLNESNIFKSQINTSGEYVRAYKLKIINDRGDTVIYYPNDPTPCGQIKNKDFLSITGINSNLTATVPIGTSYYSDSSCTTKVGTTDSVLNYSYDSSTQKFTIIINSTVYYIKPLVYFDTTLSTPAPKAFVNGKDYQWAMRAYTQLPGANTQPSTVVCEGYTVGSTKYIIWMRLADHGETGANKIIADNIIYDRYIELIAQDANDIILGGHDSDDKTKPASSKYPYIQRKKIDWVTKELGNDKDIIKIECSENFDYNYVDGIPFKIYRCSSDHTVTSAFADPNTNINISNYIMIYNNITDAQSARTAGDNPSSITVTPKYGSRKITGYSSDTGEIRVLDSWDSAPENGMAYRIFSYNTTTKSYTELFTSDLIFKIPANKSYYKNYVAKESKYYSDKACTTEAGTLSADTEYTFVNTTYGTITKSNVVYYVPTPTAAGTTSKIYVTNNVQGTYGTFVMDSNTYYVQYSDLTAYNGDTVISNPYSLQMIGGSPIENAAFKVLSNRWDETDGVNHRIFIQPNINIKSDTTNPNELVFSNGSRLNIVEQYYTNSVTHKRVDVTFNKLDDTQWLLENYINNESGQTLYTEGTIALPYISITSRGKAIKVIPPQTDYTVYTDFMDNTPYNVFYARQTPDIIITAHDQHDETVYPISYSADQATNEIYPQALMPFTLDDIISYKIESTGGNNNYYSSIIEASDQNPITYYSRTYDPSTGNCSYESAGTLTSQTKCELYTEDHGSELGYCRFKLSSKDKNYYYVPSNLQWRGTISLTWESYPIVSSRYYLPIGTPYYNDANLGTMIGRIEQDDIPYYRDSLDNYYFYYNLQKYYVELYDASTSRYISAGYQAFYIVDDNILYYIPRNSFHSNVQRIGNFSKYLYKVTSINNYIYGEIETQDLSAVTMYFAPPIYEYRDITFKSYVLNWNLLKYYNYTLLDGKGEIIDSSENIYSDDLTYSFKGLASTDDDKPDFYTIVLNIVDTYDKEFTKSITFGIYYYVHTSSIPLEIAVDCDQEKNITINMLDLLAIKSTDYSTYTTVDETDIKILGDGGITNYLKIPANKILNYTDIYKGTQKLTTEIQMGKDITQLFQFRIDPEFLQGMQTQESPVMSFIHDYPSGRINYTSVSAQNITAYFSDLYKFYSSVGTGTFNFVYKSQGWTIQDSTYNISGHNLTVGGAGPQYLDHVLVLNKYGASIDSDINIHEIILNNNGTTVNILNNGIALNTPSGTSVQIGDALTIEVIDTETLELRMRALQLLGTTITNPASLTLYNTYNSTPIEQALYYDNSYNTYYSFPDKEGLAFLTDASQYGKLWITVYIVVNSDSTTNEGHRVVAYLATERLSY